MFAEWKMQGWLPQVPSWIVSSRIILLFPENLKSVHEPTTTGNHPEFIGVKIQDHMGKGSWTIQFYMWYQQVTQVQTQLEHTACTNATFIKGAV